MTLQLLHENVLDLIINRKPPLNISLSKVSYLYKHTRFGRSIKGNIQDRQWINTPKSNKANGTICFTSEMDRSRA